MNSKNIKYVIGACLVGMVVTSCQSWKFRGFQFPIVLRSPIDWEYFKNKEQAEVEPQRPQHEEERAETAAIVRPEIQEVKPEGANAEPPKEKKKISRKAQPAEKKRAKPVVSGDQKKKKSEQKKPSSATGKSKKTEKQVITAPAW